MHRSWLLWSLLFLGLTSPCWATMTECSYAPDCGCGPQYALAQQVRTRELTEPERQQVVGCGLAVYEYLDEALQLARGTPPVYRAPLPLSATRPGMEEALNDLLREVSTSGEPRTEWIDAFWVKYRLAAHQALLFWRRGVLHPRIPQLALSDGYLPSEYDYCDSSCRYYQFLDAEPAALPDKVIFLLSRTDVDSTPASVRFFELEKPGLDAAFALYQAGWPGVAEGSKRHLSVRLKSHLLHSGDVRARLVAPDIQRPVNVPLGQRDLSRSLAYLLLNGCAEGRVRAEGERNRRTGSP